MTIHAIVTGHSKGLGAGMTRALLSRGVKVLGLSRSALAGCDHDYLNEVSLDFSDMEATKNWAASMHLGNFVKVASRVLLINNAGIVEPIGPLGTQGADGILKAVSINIAGPFLLADAFVRETSGIADRRIAHISSGAGRNGYAGWSVYCATKAALDHHVRAAQEDNVSHLKLASVAPGVIDTDMQSVIRATDLEDFPNRERFEALKETGSLSDPDQAGESLVNWMLSDAFGEDPTPDIRNI